MPVHRNTLAFIKRNWSAARRRIWYGKRTNTSMATRRFRRYRKSGASLRRSRRFYRRRGNGRRFRNRFGRRGSNRRFWRSGGLVSTQEKAVKYKFSHTRRQRRFSKPMQNKLQNFLGDKYKFRINAKYFIKDADATVNGTFGFTWILPDLLKQLFDYCHYQNAKKWTPTGDASTAATRAVWKEKAKFLKIRIAYRITNPTTAPVVCRFSEVIAKRDIPWAMAVTGSDIHHPVNNTYIYILSQGRFNEAPQNDPAFLRSDDTYNFYRNKFQSFPTISYYFNIHPQKEVTIAPGASADFIHQYTPSMALTARLWQWSAAGQWLGGSVTLGGIAMWKGLNDRSELIEIKGVDAIRNSSVPTSTATSATIPMVLVQRETSIELLYVPYQLGGTYMQIVNDDGTNIDLCDTNAVIAHETIPTRTTVAFG